jgi:putative NADPH-quinone reductase
VPRSVVILANPAADSFCHELAQRAGVGLRAAGNEVADLDLYAIGFRAAMSAEERLAYHSDEPVLDPVVADHIELIRAADTLVFVYPTWWSGLPAILKGWLERVMVPGVSFGFDDRGKVRPALTNVDRIVGVSTYGSPRSYVRAINDNGRRTLTRALRMSCGLRTRTRWHGFYGIDTSTEVERRDFAAMIERRLAER